MTPTLHLDFPHTWTAEILAAPPLIAPARHITLPRRVPGEEEAMARGALELLIRPAPHAVDIPAPPAFLATCALGFANPQLPAGVWSCPDPDELCAIAGGYAYLVPVNDPDQSRQLPLRPVTAVLPVPPTDDQPGLVVFAGFHHLVAWSATGLAWTTARLSWEGITLTGIQPDGQLHGTGWDMMSDREIPFSVDLRTGAHRGSPFSPKGSPFPPTL